FFPSTRRHTRFSRDWSSDVCSSDLVEPEHFAGLFHAHQTELQSARGENESKDFILEYVYQLAPRSIRNPVDFWRELLRMHFANQIGRASCRERINRLRTSGRNPTTA